MRLIEKKKMFPDRVHASHFLGWNIRPVQKETQRLLLSVVWLWLPGDQLLQAPAAMPSMQGRTVPSNYEPNKPLLCQIPVIAPRKVNKTVRTSYSYVPKKVPIVMRKLYRSVFFECALVVCLQVDLCEDLRIPEAWARQWWVRTAEWELGIEPGSLQRGPNQ